MKNKPAPEITPQLAISAYAVLHQYCNSISPHDCNRCAFYEHCPECFMGVPGRAGRGNQKITKQRIKLESRYLPALF